MGGGERNEEVERSMEGGKGGEGKILDGRKQEYRATM